jgi:CRISPR/Cas system-associated exonuclease Cas4 (RecB family)
MFDLTAPAPMKNLSVSKIEKMLLCPKNFELQYIHKIPEPRSWKAHAGVVVHHVIEEALHQYAKSGTYPDWQTMDDRFEPAWEEEVKEQTSKPWFVGWKEEADDPIETLRKEYRRLIRVARDEVLPTVRPWMIGKDPVVEQRIDFEIRTKFGLCPIIGYVDMLDASGVLMDWKSTGKKVSNRAKTTWLQFAAYSLWAWPVVGEQELKCEKIFLVRGENDDPHAERVSFTMGRKHREYFIKVAAQVWETMHHNIYIANPNTWLCKPGWCPFYAGCMGELVKVKDDDKAAAPTS